MPENEENPLEASPEARASEAPVPDKFYFKIGEVAKLVGVEPYVLRYWETEFPQIRPVKSKANQRLYRRDNVDVIREVRTLLYDEKYTIRGARRALSSKTRIIRRRAGEAEPASAVPSRSAPIVVPHSAEPQRLYDVISEMDAFLKD